MKSLAPPNKKAQKSSQNFLLSPRVNDKDDYHENWSYSFGGKRKDKPQAERQYSSILQKKDEKETYEMSAKQKEMISSLSKIFLSQNQRPQKILVKIKQMKRCQPKDEHRDNCPNCRIDRVQISTLPQNYKGSNLKLKSSFKDIPQISDIVLDLHTPSEYGNSGIQVYDLASSIYQQKRAKELNIRKVIAITYQPENNNELPRIRSANQIAFSKFRKPVHNSVQSNLQLNNQTSLDQLYGESTSPSKEANFTKLLELSAFLTRKNVEKQLLSVSNAANEKIGNEYKNLKSQLNSERLTSNNKIQQLTKQVQKYKKQLLQQKIANNQLNAQVAALDKKSKQLRQINESFLRQNNNLKQKLKENTKILQELRKEITREPNIEYPIEGKYRPNSPNITIRYNQKTIQEGIKKAVSVANQKYLNRYTDRSPKGNKVLAEPQNNSFLNFTQELNCQGQKPSNVRLRQTISRGYELDTNKQPPSKDPSVKSQRVVGIRKNSPRVDPSSLQQKNLVKFSSFSDFQDHNSNIIYSSKNERQNKSLSNYSGLSGSLSQRVGFLQKPVTEAKKGMLVDYMIEDMVERKELQEKQGTFAKQDKPNVRPNDVQRERFQYKNGK